MWALITGIESLTDSKYCLESLLGLVRRHDLHDIDSALSGVDFHLPCFSPLFKGREVILEFLVVVLVGYPLEK